MTGVRVGVIFQSISATITALIVAFTASWKLTLVVLCFVPMIVLTGILEGKKQKNIGQSKTKSSLSEQGGQVELNSMRDEFNSLKGLVCK